MSCYEWERGTIKIPGKDWPTFRKGLIEKWNDIQLQVLALGEEAYKVVKEMPEPQKALADWTNRSSDSARMQYHDAIFGLLFAYNQETRQYDFRRPLKQNLKTMPVSKGGTLHLSDATIVLDDKTKTVHWSVGENNHACEHAHAHPMAKALFSALARINWTRGSGGTIVGNDEYNRDSYSEGGGGNYTKSTYGPTPKPRTKKGIFLQRYCQPRY